MANSPQRSLADAISAPATGDLLVYDGTNWTTLTAGTEDTVLTMGATEPEWGPIIESGSISGGEFDPTPREDDNITASSLAFDNFIYYRVGDIVTCNFAVNYTVVAEHAFVRFGSDLPFATTITDIYDCSGFCAQQDDAFWDFSEPGQIFGYVADDEWQAEVWFSDADPAEDPGPYGTFCRGSFAYFIV